MSDKAEFEKGRIEFENSSLDGNLITINGKLYLVGAKALQRFFKENVGVELGEKAAYKFIREKITDKKRITINGRSMVAISLDEVEAKIQKRYNLLFSNSREEREDILKSFSQTDEQDFEKKKDEIVQKLKEVLVLLSSVSPSKISQDKEVLDLLEKILRYSELCIWIKENNFEKVHHDEE